jgi:hypothetical protein
MAHANRFLASPESRVRMSLRSLRFLPVMLVLFAGCSKRTESEPPPLSQKPAEVAAPAGLVAELTVPDPQHLWASLRKLGGPRAESLTPNFELAFFFAFGITRRVGGFVRPDTPVIGVVLAPPGEEPALVLGVRTVRGAELVEELTRSGGGFRVERDGSPVTLLIGSQAEPPLGIVDDWLVTSRDAKSLRAAAPYVARTLGARRPSEAPLTLAVVRGALEGPLTQEINERWVKARTTLAAKASETRKKHGRPADFADPEAVLSLGDGAVRTLVGLFASSESLTLVLRPETDRLELLVTLGPRAGGELARAVAALEVGSLDPLLALPQSGFAVLSRSSDAERAASAENPADALRGLLGPRLSEKDAAPLADALRSFHRGRGSVTLFGVLAGGEPFVKQDARHPKELERGILGLVASGRIPAIAAPLEPFVGKIGVPERVAPAAGIDGPALRVGLGRMGSGKPGELLLQVLGETAVLVASENARPGLVALTRSENPIGKAPAVAKLAEGRPDAALALYAEVSALAIAGEQPASAPVLGVIGKRGRDALFELAVSAPACTVIVERFGSP